MILQSSTDNSSEKLFMPNQKMAGGDANEHRDGNFIMAKEDILDKWKPAVVNVKCLIEKIEEVTPNNMDQALYEATNTFKAACVDLVAMKDVMLNLHSKAMSNPKFGEKYIMVLGHLSNYVVDNVSVRSELLGFIENEFKIKETMFQSDTAKFINAVILLGNVYHLVKIHGVPLKVLAMPMLDYLYLLLEGREDHHKVFAIQILLNGDKIFKTENLGNKLGLLKQSMRRALIARELTPKSKCWILLALDYMSNDLKPLSGDVVNFYAEALGDDYSHVAHLLKQPSVSPSVAPSITPTITTSITPSITPTITTSITPSITQTVTTSIAPNMAPSFVPSTAPSITQTITPSIPPTMAPSFTPNMPPSFGPSTTTNMPPSFGPSSARSIAPSIPAGIPPSFTPRMAPNFMPGTPPRMAPNFMPGTGPNMPPNFMPGTAQNMPPSFGPATPPRMPPNFMPGTGPNMPPGFGPSTPPRMPPNFMPGTGPNMSPGFGPSTTPNMPPSFGPSTTRSMASSLPPRFTPRMPSNFMPGTAQNMPPSFGPSTTPDMQPSFTPSMAPSFTPSMAPSFTPSITPSMAPNFTPSIPRSIAQENTLEKDLEKKKKKSVTMESNTTNSDDVFKDIENLAIPPELLHTANTKYKPPRFCKFLSPIPRLNNNSNNINGREERNSHHTGGRESNQPKNEEDDLYGLQVEKDRVKKNQSKRN